MGNEILQMRNICKQFPGTKALDNINLSIQRNEIHVLLGENGSGKSTLLKILAGVCKKDSGEILVDGNLVEIKNPKQSKNLGIHVIFQEPELVPDLTVYENLFLGNELEIKNLFHLPYLNIKCMIKLTKQLFSKLQIELNPYDKVQNLGVTQKQFIQLGRALLNNPKIIIMDEFTASLTESATQKIFILLKELKAAGKTIIFISHQISEVKLIGDRVTILKDGKIVSTEIIANIIPKSMVMLMLGKDIKDHYPKLPVEIGGEVLRISNLSGKGINNVSFTLRKGEILGIAGLLGSGRTNLARTIIGLEKKESGNVYIDSQEVKIKSPLDAIKNKIGYISENMNEQGLFLFLSITENITIANIDKISSYKIISLKKEKEIVDNLIEKLGIKAVSITQRILNLSNGNKQKAIIARCLLSDSNIFIFDEPTMGVDIAGKVEIYNLMNDLVMNGASILLISSDFSELIGMSNRILILYKGVIRKELPREEANNEILFHYACGN